MLRARLGQDLIRRVRNRQELGMRSAVRTHARERLRELEAIVLVYINRHEPAFLFSVAAWSENAPAFPTRPTRPEIEPEFLAMRLCARSRASVSRRLRKQIAMWYTMYHDTT